MVSVGDFGLFTGGCAGGGGVVASRVASGGDARGGVHRLTPGVVQRVIRESGAHRRQTYEMEKKAMEIPANIRPERPNHKPFPGVPTATTTRLGTRYILTNL